MSQTVQFVDFKQLLAQQGDTSSLSEAELGRLKKKYEKLQKEWARKRRKLEKLDRAARAKQHVRRKLQEQQSQTGGAVDTSSPIQQQRCGGDPPVIRGQLFPGRCPRDGINEEEPTREGKGVHHHQEDFTCGKSVSFSLDIAPDDENTQYEHPAKFEICKLSTVPTSKKNAVKSTDKFKVCNVSKAGDVSKQGAQQGSIARESNSLASDENSTQNTNSTSVKCDSNDATVQEEDVSIVQESSATLGLGSASECIREELGENEYDRNVSEQGDHFDDATQGNIQETTNRKPLFKGSFRQTIQTESLEQTAGLDGKKISIQTQEEDLKTTREKLPRNSSTCSALDLSVEYVNGNLSQCRVPESSHCEGQMPGQQNQLPLANSTIVLDSEEDETECIDEFHHSHDIHAKNQTNQKKNTGIIGSEQKGKPSNLDTQSQRNVTELSPGQETLEEGNYGNKKVSKNCVELSSGQKDVHEEDKSQIVEPSQGTTKEGNDDNKKVAKNSGKLSSGQEYLHEEDNSQIVEPSQGNFNKNTWVDGLMFPAEYYVRTTRRMQRQGLTPEGVARQVKARTQRKQKRKVECNKDGALEGTVVKKQAKLDVAGTSGAVSSGSEVGESTALSLNDAKDYKTLAKEDEKSTMQKLSPVDNASISEDIGNSSGPHRSLKTSTEGITNKMENKDVDLPGVPRLESESVEDLSTIGVQVCTATSEKQLSTGVQVCSSTGEKSTDGEFENAVIPDTQYILSKSSFPLQDFQEGLSNLPKDLVCEGIVQDKLQVLRKGRKASSTHNTPVQSSGLGSLVKGRKKTRSCQNSPVQSTSGCSSVKGGEENVQDCPQVMDSEVQRLVNGRKKTRSCQNPPVQTGCSRVLKEGEESVQDCSQVVEVQRLVHGRKTTRSCQNSPVQSGCSSVLEGVEESVQNCSQVVEVQRLVKGRKTTRSCQNSPEPVQTGWLNVLEGGEEIVQDCSQVVEGDGLCRRSKRLKHRYSQEVQNSTSQEQTALKEVQASTAQRESEFCKGSQEVQNSTSQEQKALKEVRALTAQPESKFLKGHQDSKKETWRFFPVLSDQLRVKLSNSEATEFHLPYSDYGTLKVAKAREAPSADVSKKCSSRSSSKMDAKDVGMPSKDSSVNHKKENQAILLGAESLLPSRSNKNLDVASRVSSCKANSPNLASKTKDASMSSKEASVKNKKEDQPLPISVESLLHLRSNRNLDVSVNLSSSKGNSPKLEVASKAELGQEKSRTLFPSLSSMLHKKCTEAVLDFSLVGTDYVKLKLNKVKSSPQPAAATSSYGLNSKHRKDRHPMSKAKGNLQTSSSNSKNLAKENNSCVKQPSEDVTAVRIRQQQKVHDVVEEKASRMLKEDNLLQNNKKNEFSRTTSPDTSVQPSFGTEVRVSDSGMQAPCKCEEEGTSAMSYPCVEDQHAFADVDRNKVGTMCENRKLPVTASTKPLEPRNLVVSNCKSPCSKAIEMTPPENNGICASQASQDRETVMDKGRTVRDIPCSDYTEPISLENNEMRICESQASTVVNEGTHREIPCSVFTKPISQKMEDTAMKHCVRITSDCFNERTSGSESLLRPTPVEGGDEREAGQTGVEETGEEGVAMRVTDLSTCLKPTATTEAVVFVALGEARIHEEHAAVLAVCQQTTVSLWLHLGEDWAPGASWEIPEYEEVCDVFLLPCEVGVQVMVGGNFTTGFIKFFHYDGVSVSSQDHSWDEGVALVGDGFHGDGCHGDSFHAMAVLPQGVAMATGPSDGGSSVWKVTMSSPAGHVEQQTKLPVPAAQRIGSLQQVEGCAGCLMGTGDNQVLLWNHTAGVLLRCVNLPGAHPTCLYTASAQGLLFAVVCSPAEEHQDTCHLVAINPRTGRSLSLQKYQLPHGSSLARCTNGVMDGPRLLIIHDNGGLYLWDFCSGEMEPVLPGVCKKPSCVTTGKEPL